MDLHPEELLDGEAAGTLTAAELERLNAHCCACATCALLRAARSDFARAMVPVARDEAAALAALAAFEGRPKVALVTLARSSVMTSSRSSSRSWGFMRVAAGFAVIALAGTAGAVGMAKLGIIHISVLSDPPPEPVRAPRAHNPTPTPQARPPVPSLVEELAPPPVTEPAPPPRAARGRADVPSVVGVAELFAGANHARRAGNGGDAVRLYGELIRVYPDSEQASQSRVSLGSLLLHLNNAPARALQQFDAYLARNPRGSLAEEARVGRAMTLGRLGRRAPERQAWQDILERHPGSIHADQARRRLEDLR